MTSAISRNGSKQICKFRAMIIGKYVLSIWPYLKVCFLFLIFDVKYRCLFTKVMDFISDYKTLCILSRARHADGPDYLMHCKILFEYVIG